MKDTTNDCIIRTITEKMKEHGLNQQQLGDLVGRTQQSISSIQTGKTKLSAEDVVIFANALHTDPDYLLTGVHKEHYEAAEMYGLSGEALDMLKMCKESFDKACELYPASSDELNHYVYALESLILHPDLTLLIGRYLSEEHNMITAWRYFTPSEGKHEGKRIHIRARDVVDFDEDSFESIYRLKIMDGLMKLREELTPDREERSKRLGDMLRAMSQEGIQETQNKVDEQIRIMKGEE